MSGVNKVILVGNAGKDPEVRYLENKVPVAKFSLATNESYKTKDGQKVDQTEWHQIVLWRGLAEVAEKYVRKGTLLYIEGKIKSRSWDDKDGVKRYTTEIIGDSMTILTKKGEETYTPSGNVESSSRIADTVSDSGSVPSDDLPF